MCRINWSEGGRGSHFLMAYICVYFVCMEHTFIVVLLECFVELYFLFKKALSSTSFANMGLTFQYINPIEVLQDQYIGWESRCYHIQTFVLPTQLRNDLIIYFGKWVIHSRLT